MAAGIDTKELEICIKGLLISRPTVVRASLLQRECEQELGKTFPFRQLGFPTFVDYLRSIPTVVQLEPHNGHNPDVYPVASKASSHIDQLVSKQRVPPARRRGVARQGAYNSRHPVRRRPARVIPQPTPTVGRPNQGIDSIDLERHMRNLYDGSDLTRNRIHNVNNLLSHAGGMVKQVDTKVYPNFSGNSVPAGYEEDEYDDFDDVFCEDDARKDSEEEMSNEAIELWSKALGVQENGTSPRSSAMREETDTHNSKVEIIGSSEHIPEDDSNISRGMIKNFRKILNDYPEGIWASQLQQLYFDRFHVALNFLDLGYTSAISLASSLPSVFSFQRDGSHDWKLYDARYVTQESLNDYEDRDNNAENRRYIPQTIIEKVKKLLDDNPNGFRSTDLLQKYQDTFRKALDLEILGFNTLEEFLKILENDVTLRKVSNYYILLPKHKVVHYKEIEPSRPDERLIVPAEALCVPIPENVLKLGDKIPLQKLPPIEIDPTKPLLELEVRVAEVISPVNFHIILDSTYEELENLMDDLHKFYEWEEANFQIPLPHFTTNLYCAAKYESFWHRARITRVRGSGDVEIEYIDYGTPDKKRSSELRYLSKEFATLPSQAICAKLIGVKPKNGESLFPKEVCETFLTLVQEKRLVAHVYNVAEKVRNSQEKMQLELILYDVDNKKGEIVLNDYLIENGFASPVTQMRDVSTEDQQLVEGFLPESEFISLQECGPPTSPPPSGLPTSQFTSGSPSLAAGGSSFPGNSSTSLSTTLKTQEEKKTRGPPPGFEKIPIVQDFDSSAPLPTSSSSHWTNNQAQLPNYYSTEQEQRFFFNYLMNPTEVYPELFLHEQYIPHNVYRPNPSNMPLVGPPLMKSANLNMSRRPLTYGSYGPPQNFCSVPLPISNNYFPVNANVPVTMPISNSYLLMNSSIPPNYLFHTPAFNQYLLPPGPSNLVGDVSSKGQEYSRDIPLHSSSVHAVHYPKHLSTPTRASNTPASSPVPTHTPTTFPEWPPKNLPRSYTSSTKSESSEGNLITRPCTPLTPASAEVANICKQSRSNSSASQISENSPQNSAGLSCNSDMDQSPIGSAPLNLQTDIIPPSNAASNLQINRSPTGNATSYSQNQIIKNDSSRNNSGTFVDDKTYTHQHFGIKDIPLPSEIDVKGIPLPSPSPENLFPAINSPVESVFNTPTPKEESSDDYVSACENVDEVKQKLNNLCMTEPLKSSCESNEDIPDSWENLELDDTPAKAANFSVDFSQPLDLIINNIGSDVPEVKKSAEPEAKNQISPPSTIPVNWKDAFNPDTASLERSNKKNQVKGISPSPVKFDVKKIPVQKLEIQGKFFHLLYVNNVPAVIPAEFFKQFITTINPGVAEKIVECSNDKFYSISKAEHPAILAELDKVAEFCGSVPKRAVIRVNKVRVINLSEIPQCLQILNVPNKALLDDLKKITNEFKL